MQEAIENDDETFLDLEFSSDENEIIEEEEEEIKEVYNGVFLLDDKYYVVDPDGDGSELVELIICDVNEDVTAMARTLLISTSYQEDQIKQVKHLESVSNSVTTKQINNIIALQTQIRLWEAKQLPEIPSMKERYNMMKELKESERKYLDNLKILQTHYLKKLLEEKDDKIIKNCLKNLEMIIKYNETFIKDLTDDNKVNVYGKGVGGVFKKFTGFMKCYTLYINSHEVTNDHVVALKKKKAFAGLLTKLTTSPEVKNQTIFSYLILPIQRIPRYELFIRGMLKNIPKWSNEFGQLKEILELINKTASYLNERRREMEYKTQLKKFKHNLIIKKFDLLDKDTRRLCKYSSLECEEYGHVILFLLNDIFLIHKAKQSYSDIDALIEKTKLKIKHVVPLVGVGIFHISETSFQVTSKIGSLTFTTATSNEKNDWMNAFDEVLAREQSSAVSRLNTFRQTQEVQTTKVDTIYFEGYLKTSLKMFEKYVGSVVKFHPSVNIKKKDSGSNLTQNSTKMYNSPRNDSIIRPSPQIGLISPRLTITFRTPRYYRIQNDHDEEKQRFVTVDGEFMTFFQSVSDAIENKWHMKVALNGISVESGVVINRPASFHINISGDSQILDAPSIDAKWKWISVLRASFYASSKDCLTTQKIIPNAKEIKYYSPPPPLVCSERGPYASFLDLLLNSPTNSVCCDCGDDKLSYADVTYGVFLCRDCSTLHKNLLKSQIIHIKTLYCKTEEDVFLFKNKGNAFVNGVVEKNMPESISRPPIEDLKNSISLRQDFIPIKYSYVKSTNAK
ncbi:Rho/RAC guanine nucleotide exchange factor [Entamoeba marina]